MSSPPTSNPTIPARSSSTRHRQSHSRSLSQTLSFTPLSISRPTSALPPLNPEGEISTASKETIRALSTGSDVEMSVNNMDEPVHRKIYERGLEMRKKVVGEEYVAKSLKMSEKNEFMRPLVQYATEAAWGTIWTRPGLELKTRSLLNLVMLTALGKWTELGTHVRGAVRNGCTEVEIRESLLQATAYCGMPAGMEAFRVADRVLTEMKEKGEM